MEDKKNMLAQMLRRHNMNKSESKPGRDLGDMHPGEVPAETDDSLTPEGLQEAMADWHDAMKAGDHARMAAAFHDAHSICSSGTHIDGGMDGQDDGKE